MRQPRNPDDWAPALPLPQRAGERRPVAAPVRPPTRPARVGGPREARVLCGCGGIGRARGASGAPDPEMRARRAGRGRPPRGAGRCARGGGVSAPSSAPHRRHPPPHPLGSVVSRPRPAGARARSNDRRRADPRNPASASAVGVVGAARAGVAGGRATWLILPVVICLSQRLSHACVSMN
ncbi:unnamed protein product [Spirodela intermedia]|uniref:Uncharacterized protein n=1 Tax=Spirodela intermedia TaxID=51605 RepID=A0ABN7ECQ7_SPIIN|nr:unnamed protein product [Spirodela intermedia]